MEVFSTIDPEIHGTPTDLSPYPHCIFLLADLNIWRKNFFTYPKVDLIQCMEANILYSMTKEFRSRPEPIFFDWRQANH